MGDCPFPKVKKAIHSLLLGLETQLEHNFIVNVGILIKSNKSPLIH